MGYHEDILGVWWNIHQKSDVWGCLNFGYRYTTSYNNVCNGKLWGNMRKHYVNIYRCTQEKALISEHKVHAEAAGIHRYWKRRWTTNYYLSAYMVKWLNESHMNWQLPKIDELPGSKCPFIADVPSFSSRIFPYVPHGFPLNLQFSHFMWMFPKIGGAPPYIGLKNRPYIC